MLFGATIPFRMRPTCSSLLSACGLPALLITDLVHIRYLTGMNVTAGTILASGRTYTLFLDPRYIDAATALPPGVTARPYEDLDRLLAKVPLCGFDEDDVTVARLRMWKSKFKNTKFVRSDDELAEFRRQKDDRELTHLTRAYKITQELLRRVPSALRAGVTEKAVAWKLQTWAQELGADGLAFPPIVGFGTHTALPHHRPTTRTLKKGHVVQIDVGATYRGYNADMAQVYFTAKPSDFQQTMLGAIREAKDYAASLLVAGADTAQVDTKVRALLKKRGFPQGYPHALGHGVGLEVHDPGVLSSRRKGQTILHKEVYAVEPGLYFPGRFGMRVEDMVVVP
jgi:Xaa-Pro aminopeptidase